MTTRLCLIRHGETDWNAQGRFQGQLDIPLNAAGIRQAAAAARGLAGQSFAAAYSSDLARTRDTAAAIVAGSGLEVDVAEALRERHFGALQGLTMAEALSARPLVHRRYLDRDPDFDLEGGESLGAFAKRVLDALEALVRRHPGQAILAVTHGGVLDIAYRHATGRSLRAARDFTIANAAFNWFEHDGGWRVTLWGECGHLEG